MVAYDVICMLCGRHVGIIRAKQFTPAPQLKGVAAGQRPRRCPHCGGTLYCEPLEENKLFADV